MKQPKALYFLNFISMWECFSYYGMRVLLILFMMNQWKYSELQALSVYALYSTVIEFGALLGGYAADRFLGIKNAIKLGGITITLGHICLMIPESEGSFYLGLGAIIAGTSFFRSNLPALLSEFYEEKDVRRDSGFTLYYAGINFGAFLATIGCSFVAESYGWNYGFGLAALGMMLGMVVFFTNNKYFLEGKGESVVAVDYKLFKGVLFLTVITLISMSILYFSQVFSSIFLVMICALLTLFYKKMKKKGEISVIESKKLKLYIGLLVLFYGCEEQIGSSLLLFADKFVNKETTLGTIPSSSIIMGNPLTILIMGPLISYLFQKKNIDILNKIAFSFSLLALSFFILFLTILRVEFGNQISVIYLILSIVILSIGELFIGPTIYSKVSEMGSTASKGMMMGMMTIGFSLANTFGGFLSQLFVDENMDIKIYANNFLLIGVVALCVSLFIGMSGIKEKIA